MKKTGFLYDDRFLLHRTGTYHPEVPDRLKAIYKGIDDGGLLDSLTRIKASRVSQQWIEAVHDIRYIMRFEEACISGFPDFDHSDNQICPESYEVALLAIGGLLDTADLLMEKKIENAFCAVRPPGHHAECDKAMGFCYFNNIAIVARYLQKKWGIKRVGIVDFDVHHGNGTQSIFDKDSSVFYYSIHQHPSFSYPGTGREFERGSGEGHGYTINSLALPGNSDDHYKELIERDLFPAFKIYDPDIILVSAGFDAHTEDEMSDMNLSTDAFSWIMEKIVGMAGKYCDGRVMSILEGGYKLSVLPELAKNHVEILLNA